MSSARPDFKRPKIQPMRCSSTARQLADLAQEVLEATKVAQADQSLVDAYEQALEHYSAKAKRLY